VSALRFRLLISTVLMLGVTVSAVLIAVGFIGSLLVGWRGSLVGGLPAAGSLADFGGVVEGIGRLRPQAIAQLGLITLVATPVVRVLTSLIVFGVEGDRLYITITAVVLAILLASVLFIR
jgi:uncharacterized membrane protein